MRRTQRYCEELSQVSGKRNFRTLAGHPVYLNSKVAEITPRTENKKQNHETSNQQMKPRSKSATLNQIRMVLDYIFASLPEDNRPYLDVQILGMHFRGLLDTGANYTIFGKPGWDILRKSGFTLLPADIGSCRVANEEMCEVIGTVEVPFCLENRLKTLRVYIVPALPHTLVLGMDFWLSMEIVPDFKNKSWSFNNSYDSRLTNSLCSISTENKNRTLSEKQLLQLNTLVDNYFANMKKPLGKTSLIEHKIILTDPQPIKLRPYRVSPAIQEKIDKEIKSMLDDDVIEPSKSAFSFPVIMVPKKEKGSYRFCVDYRQLNKVTKKDAYPIPFISGILDMLGHARYISSVDVKSAFFQVPVAVESREYTAFSVPGRGLYQFKRMPFGLANSPATFQRLMDRVLGSELEPFAFVYLDDIIIVTDSFEKHLQVLESVFNRLTESGLTLSREKCKFCQSELKYLGYVVDEQGLHCDPDKVKAILEIPTPKNPTEIRRLIGTASWYRRFIPNFSGMIAPITALLRKNKKWEWTEDCEDSFRKIKDCLVSSPILSCPDFTKPFQLQTDASAYGIGAVLSQISDDGEQVIAYVSRSLSRTERNYSTVERENLAIVWSIEKLRAYLEGYTFTVVTDHHSLTWLYKLPQPTGRLARWIMRLQQFDFHVIHRKGADNIVPDMLSRTVPNIDKVDIRGPGNEVAAVRDKWYLKQIQLVEEHPLNYPLWRVTNNKLYKHVANRYSRLIGPENDWKLVVPKEDRREILIKSHDDPKSGHAGIYKTFQRISTNYYWPKLKCDVSKYVRTCKTCLASKPDQQFPAGLLCGRPSVKRPWELVSVDIVGPLPKSTNGFRYILSIQDYFSKFCIFQPMRTATSKTICKILEDHVLLLFGVPKTLLTDNGKQFVSHEFKNFAKSYGVKVIHTANYHPQANACERQHRTLKTMLRSYVADNHRKWDQFLQKVACAIRTSVSESTKVTPFLMNFGREIIIDGNDHSNRILNDDDEPTDKSKELEKLFTDVRQRLDKAFQNSKNRYDLRRRNVSYSVGQKVWLKNHVQSDATNYFTASLAPKFRGPLIINQKVSPWTYQLKDANGSLCGIWHCKDLKPDTDLGSESALL